MTRPGEAHDPPPDVTTIPPPIPPPTYPATDRLFTVKDAGEILGISPEAVRARLKRGTLHRETGEDGTVYVRLDAAATDDGSDGTNGWTGNGTGAGEGQGDGERLDDLREEVAFLREELSREREARVKEKRRHDTIVLQLAQRIPELEAQRETPLETRDAPETVSGDARNGTGRDGNRSEPRRSWLYRFFFGE
jgi:hypothetical protein